MSADTNHLACTMSIHNIIKYMCSLVGTVYSTWCKWVRANMCVYSLQVLLVVVVLTNTAGSYM